MWELESISESHRWLRRELSLGSAVSDDLLPCNHSPSFENFSVITKENQTFLLELKEGLLIMRDKPSLNRKIRSTPLYLFDRV